MGKKRVRKRKHLFLYCAGLSIILFSFAACAITSNLKKKPDGSKHLAQSDIFLKNGDYDGAIKENEQVLGLFPDSSPGDTALFQIGLIWAYPDNPQKNYAKTLEYFQKLAHDFPESALIKEAKVLTNTVNEINQNNGKINEQDETITVLKQQIISLKDSGTKIEGKNKELEDTIKALKKQIIASRDAEQNMEEKNKELEETIKALKKQINALKEIDLKIEEKKREDLPGK